MTTPNPGSSPEPSPGATPDGEGALHSELRRVRRERDLAREELARTRAERDRLRVDLMLADLAKPATTSRQASTHASSTTFGPRSSRPAPWPRRRRQTWPPTGPR